MTLPIERARTRRPVTWLTVLGVLLLPAVLGGILVTALYNPTERLDAMTAAIVNDDEPVTIDGQLTPLGRQLTAGLVEGSDEIDSNLTWIVSNADDAADGLADGTYQAVVTIPENFSATATSAGTALSGGADDPEKAVIQVTTPPDALMVDDAITAQVTAAAASVMGQTLSSLTLENVFLGFTTLGDQLGTAADGATELASGAQQAADGAAELPGGAAALSSGAGELSSGAVALAGGLGTIADQTRGAASGASQIAGGLGAIAAGLSAQPLVPTALVNLAGGTATSASTAAAQASGVSTSVADLAAGCAAAGGSVTFCADLQTAADAASTTAGTAATASGQATALSGGVSQLAAASTAPLVANLNTLSSSTVALSGGLTQLAAGVDQSATGASGLAGGATQLGGGIDQLGAGAQSLANGVAALASGTDELAGGLAEASAALPSYSDAQAQSLAEVVSDPVGTAGIGSSLFGASAIPLLAMLALWFGGLATFVALQSVTRRALSSRRPSIALALRSFGPGALIGAAQGLLVAAVVQLAASYAWDVWWAFAGIAALAGVAFAAVNQALVAVLGGAGRWVSALIGVLAVATGIVSTVPGVLSAIAGLMPTAPAYQAMLGVLASSGGVGAAITGLLVWAVLSLIATTLAVAARRTTSTRALLGAAPAPA